MIVYIDREPKFRFGKSAKFSNAYFTRLIGVNVSTGSPPEVTPVYIPFFRIEPNDGFLLIEIGAWTETAWVVILYPHWPFVYVTRGGGVDLVEMDIKDE